MKIKVKNSNFSEDKILTSFLVVRQIIFLARVITGTKWCTSLKKLKVENLYYGKILPPNFEKNMFFGEFFDF